MYFRILNGYSNKQPLLAFEKFSRKTHLPQESVSIYIIDDFVQLMFLGLYYLLT